MGRPARNEKETLNPTVLTADWRVSLYFLPSEATTVGLVLWGAARFYVDSRFPPSVWSGSLLGWVAATTASVVFGRRATPAAAAAIRGLGFAAGVYLVVLATGTLGENLDWAQIGAIGITLALALAVIRWLRAVSTGGGAIGPGEGLRWAALQGVAAYAVHPYVRCALVGAGDAYSYCLTLADYIGQARAGVRPIFMGQTEFAFNGNIHTLRTAPYFAHLGGLLDGLTLRTLPAYALTNLAILVSAGAGGLGTYAALRIYHPGRPWAALALGALYILSPAFLAPLYDGDMIATYMAVPMVPWLSLGLALAADDPDDWRAWPLQGAALAALWWAHPPIAIWATAVALGAWLALLARSGVTMARLSRMATAALLCAVLSCYAFASVLTLSLPSGPDNRAGQAWTILGNVSRNWRAEFEPLSANLGLLLGDVQLGYSLLACVALGVLVPGARRASAFLLGCILCLLVLLVPVPGLTGWLWSRVPHAVLDVTNAWPMQRLYPLCAGLAVFASWAGLSQLSLGRRRRVALLAAAMAVALAWSACEAQKLIRRAELSQRSSAQSAILFAPGNIMLSRVSYMFFGRLPGYFTNGPMDADLETRLLDERTAAVLADGTSVLGGRAAGQGRTAEMTAMGFGIAQARFPVLPMESDILRFDFLGRRPAGELQVTSRTMYGLYALPSSGSEKSFGAEARSSRKIEVRNDSDRADTVSVTFVPNATPGGWTGDSGPFARFTVEPLSRAGRVIEVRSLLPFSATVHSDREAVLETPKMVVPDYRAVVDGREVEIVPTQDGLVGVPVPAGTSDVQVAYAGGRALRWAYRVSGFSWLGLAIATAGLPFVRRQGAPWARLAAAGNFISSRVAPAFVVAGVVAALVVGAPRLWRLKVAPEPAGRRLVVMLPLGRDGASEPLIATGRTGAADVIFVNFLGGNRVSVGYDKWGVGASVSAPFEVSIAKPQTIDVSMASLARRGLWGIGGPPEAPRGVTVRWNGREVLSTARSPYPRGSDPVEIGANAVGASTCGAAFTGTVLSVSGIPSRSP